METIAEGSSELPVLLAVAIHGGRASKKRITDTKDNELPLSVHLVMSNDDLLMEILLLSPVISIIQWKSVSKRWLSLITTPAFALRRTQIPNLDPPSGLFLRRDTESYFAYDFVPLDVRIPASTSPTLTNFTWGLVSFYVKILQSCNGLLLCCIRPALDRIIYVCNPSLNLYKILPKQNYFPSVFDDGGIKFKMAFDPTKSPHYKVIHAAVIRIYGRSSSIQIQIYCSETCNWSVCGVSFSSKLFNGFSDAIYWNDAIYWVSSCYQVTRFNLNVQHPLLTSIKTPEPRDGCYHNHKLFESRGCLLSVCMVYNPPQPLYIYEMRNEHSEWLLKYCVDLDDIMVKMSFTWPWFCVRFIVLGEREDEFFLVIEHERKFFKYNFILKTFSYLCDLGPTCASVLASGIDGLPFIASLAGV